MKITAEAIEPLLRALAHHPVVTSHSLNFAPSSEARFHEIAPDTLTWDWCDRHKAERGKVNLAYYDLDGHIVSVGVVAADDEATEIELCRGDGEPIQSVPDQADLWETIVGVMYFPRA